MTKNWAAIFNAGFAGAKSEVTQRVSREVYGSEYPEGVDPYSLVSRSELVRFCTDVEVDEAGHLVDIGCGRGGPGLWVAAHTGARLTGVDIAASALRASEERARLLGLLAAAEELAAESDSDPAVLRNRLEEMIATFGTMLRRVFVVAQKRNGVSLMLDAV